MTGAELIAAERQRQIEAEGYTAEHDAEHETVQLVLAARAYLSGSVHVWPWDREGFKPRDERSNLIRAGALIAAALDRIQQSGL